MLTAQSACSLSARRRPGLSREGSVRFGEHESTCWGRVPLHVPTEDLCLASAGALLPGGGSGFGVGVGSRQAGKQPWLSAPGHGAEPVCRPRLRESGTKPQRPGDAASGGAQIARACPMLQLGQCLAAS